MFHIESKNRSVELLGQLFYSGEGSLRTPEPHHLMQRLDFPTPLLIAARTLGCAKGQSASAVNLILGNGQPCMDRTAPYVQGSQRWPCLRVG